MCQIKKLLHKLQLQDLWTKQAEANRNVYKILIGTRLDEYFREEWINSAKHSHKGKNYLELARFNCKLKPYLKLWLKTNQ